MPPVAPIRTLAALFGHAAGENHHPAVASVGSELSWTSFERRAREVGNGLLALGLPPHPVVGFAGRLRTEQLYADAGVLSVGGVTAHGEPGVEQRERYALVVGDEATALARFEPVLDTGAARIAIDEPRPADAQPLDLLAARGVAFAASHLGAFEAARDAVDPADPAVVLDDRVCGHQQLLDEAADVLRAAGLAGPGERVLLALPLARRTARLAQLGAALADATLLVPRAGTGIVEAIRNGRPEVVVASAEAVDELVAELRRDEGVGWLSARLARGRPRRGVPRSLRLVVCPVAPVDERALEELDVDVVVV